MRQPFKHYLPKKAIESIHFIPSGMGEAGYVIYLNEGYSFDPMAEVGATFIGAENRQEALNLIAYKRG